MSKVIFYNLPTKYTADSNYLADNYYLDKIPYKVGFYLPYYNYGAFKNPKNRLDFLNERFDKDEVRICFSPESIIGQASLHRNHDLWNEDMQLLIGQEMEERIPFNYYHRLPAWCLALFGLSPTIAQIQATIDLLQEKRKQVLQRERLYTFNAKRDQANFFGGVGGMILDMIADDNELGNIYVHCPGRFRHNTDELQNKFSGDELAYLEQFIFNICPETNSFLGQVSDNLATSWMSGTIPIYWGDLSIDSKYINKQALIDFDPTRRVELTGKIKDVLLNLDDFVKIPLFHDGAAQNIFNDIYLPILTKITHLLPGCDLYSLQKHPISKQFFARNITTSGYASKVQEEFYVQLTNLLRERGQLISTDNSPPTFTNSEDVAIHLPEFLTEESLANISK